MTASQLEQRRQYDTQNPDRAEIDHEIAPRGRTNQPTAPAENAASEATEAAARRPTEAEAAEQRTATDTAARERSRAESVRTAVLDWPEAVTFCMLRPNSRTEFRCDGPLQPTYGTPGRPSYSLAVREACGSDSIRELGVIDGYEAWGCGFGIRVNTQNRFGAFTDPAARLGITYVPGRITFRCPQTTGVCRSR